LILVLVEAVYPLIWYQTKSSLTEGGLDIMETICGSVKLPLSNPWNEN